MKNTLLFSLLSLLLTAVASPQSELNTPGAPAACACPKESKDFQYPPCNGSFCECRNQAIMTCWLTRPLRCKVSFMNCPAAPITNSYPRCGTIGLPTCAQGRTCRQIDASCRPGLTGCVGVCVPPSPGFSSNFPPAPQQSPAQGPAWRPQPTQQQQQPPPASQPGWLGAPNGQQGGPKIQQCPKNLSCPQDTVCVQDLQDPLAASRGPTFKCVDGSPGGTCAGFNNIQCQNGGLCVPDPRMECIGQGCTGICA